ncbi:MAG TPA: hypothetical protein VKU86_02825 [Acidimicrobiales bacterium]|nr:hypothetical protein [Acidimicrobiales bacterium]
MAAPDDRLPVIVAAAQVIERDAVVSALDLATRAADAALAPVRALRPRIDRVSFVNSISEVGTRPASDLARRLGLSPRWTEVTTIGGNSPQSLVNRAAQAVAAGELDAVLVAGAEAQRSARAGLPRASARDAPSGEPAATSPDPVVGDPRPGVGAAEMQAGLLAPVHVYALFESAIAARAGRSPAEQRVVLGELMAPFTEVAATHPTAWFAEARTPAELSQPGEDNRLVSEPYTKRLCALLQVDQAAAVVLTSLGAARAARCEDRAVFVWAGAEANDVWFPTARPDPGRSPALAAASAAALAAARSDVDDMDCFDVYSCFPSAVEMAADALGLGIRDPRGLTVTGGLPYFGGPGNNYALHAIATMTDRLRDRGGRGLLNALGWYVTKHAVGIYGASPPPAGWQLADTAWAQREIDATAVDVAPEFSGRATVVASTVAYDPSGTVTAAPVIARIADGRQIAACAEPAAQPSLAGSSLVGSTVHVSGSPPTYRVAG